MKQKKYYENMNILEAKIYSSQTKLATRKKKMQSVLSSKYSNNVDDIADNSYRMRDEEKYDAEHSDEPVEHEADYNEVDSEEIDDEEDVYEELFIDKIKNLSNSHCRCNNDSC